MMILRSNHHDPKWLSIILLTMASFLVLMVSAQTETCDPNDESCQSQPEQPPLITTCVDESDQCPSWAAKGYCHTGDFIVYMKTKCRKSCPNVCNEDDGTGTGTTTLSLGVPQDLTVSAKNAEAIQYKYAQTLEYVYDLIQKDKENEQVDNSRIITLCKNHHESCTMWAQMGECEANPPYMKTNCAPACQTCEDLDVEKRCPWDPNVQDVALQPGDLHDLFTKLTTDPQWTQQYTPTILSKPGGASDNDNDTNIIDGPWIITLDNVLTQEECDRLIELGGQLGYFRSQGGTGNLGEDGRYLSAVTEHRTSYQAWCLEDCYTDPVTQSVTKRIQDITGITEEKFEYLQLLKYDAGQYYKSHNDYIPNHLKRPMGPRVLTVYFYLSDVEEGGGTRFTKLKTTVTPKRGRAIIWPSVLDENPLANDHRTDHEALPVLKGQKYGCNAWIHQADFKAAYEKDCQT